MPDPAVAAALSRLAPPGEYEDRLAELVLSAGTVDSLARWYYQADRLRQRGFVRRCLYSHGRPLVTFCPFDAADLRTTRPGSKNGPLADNATSRVSNCNHGHQAAAQYVLSRFVYIRRCGDDMVAESPLAHARVIVHDSRLLSLLGALASPQTLDDLNRRLSDLAPDLTSGDVAPFWGMLREANLVDDVAVADCNGHPKHASSEHASLDVWEFHDLLFHARSRQGRSDGRFGGTYRFADRLPPPALKSPAAGPGVPLYRPDLSRLEREDAPLASVQERRQSIRTYAEQPITARQLGEFLFRVARVREQWQSDSPHGGGTHPIDFASRPFPSGGALYELEFYIAVTNCQDIARGLYHYDPLEHRLEPVAEWTRDVGALMADAAASAGIEPGSLQLLLILTSRFARIAWKYESIAYALTLKNVGVVFQTMYLAATAMNLAPCAIGCGNSDLFARAAGTDYYVESSVGEFLLGSRIG